MDEQSEKKPNYSVLAHVYDVLMDDVNYEAWADYIDELIQEHHHNAEKILELACGTGSLAISLNEFGCYDITATDASPEMVERAKIKGREKGSDVRFECVNFLDITLDERFDLVFAVFDSINYLHWENEILKLHSEVSKILKPGGYFIFDFTTPRNSVKAIQYLNNEEGISDDHVRFFRTSRFDPENNVHINEFEIEQLDPDHSTVLKRFVEVHKQKIYTLSEMKSIVEKTGFKIVKMYDGFRFKEATDKSLRITMVLKWQKEQ